MFGLRLTELRKKKNITQGEISKLLKIPRSTYSNYELGNREPDFDTTEKLAQLFDVSVDYLLGRTEQIEDDRSPAEKLIGYLEMELTNEEILKHMDFKVDGMTLTIEEANEFVDFVRVRRLMKKQQPTGAKYEGL